MMRGRRDLSGLDWEWALEWESRSSTRRRRLRFLIRRRWWLVALLMALVALAALTLSLSGGSAHEEEARACDHPEVSVEGNLSGSVSWCGPRGGDHVEDVIGIISVHYPGDANPCGLEPERGPGDSWFEVEGDYEIVLSGAPGASASASSAHWRYDVSGSFAICGGENSMRVTIVFITDLKGAPAWVEDFGPGAYGSRSGSFKPPSLPEATATPTIPATPTASATATPVAAVPASTPTPAATAPQAPASTAAALAAPASSAPAARRAPAAAPHAPSPSPAPTIEAKAAARAPTSPRPVATIAPGAFAPLATPGVAGLPGGGGGPGLGVIAAITLFAAGTVMMAAGLGIHRLARR